MAAYRFNSNHTLNRKGWRKSFRRPFFIQDASESLSLVSFNCMRVKEVLAASLFVSLAIVPSFPQAALSRQQQLKAHTRLAQQYLSEGKPELAVPELKAIIVLDPKNVDARGNLGVVLFFQGQYADAVPQLRAALKLQPGLWKIQSLLGLAENRLGKEDDGRRDLKAAFPHIQNEKIKMEVGNNLIDGFSSIGDLDSAATVVSDLLKLEPTDVSLLYTAYRLHSDLADQAMLTLAMVAPNSAQMHQVMAHELTRHDEKSAAIANYKEALKLNPQLPGLHFELGEVLYNSSDTALQAEAEGEYKAALAVNPSDEKAELRLGDIAAKRGDLKEAAADYSRAMQLQPNDAEADTDLAKVLVSMDQPQEAQKLLEKAAQIDPTDYVVHYRLSTLYRQQGRTEDAKRELEQYQKYKDMKEKLRKIFHQMRVETSQDTQEDMDATK
ncbi:MAG: tetratricopeptide repeat protein [Acidobacteriaceae bacterium]